MRGGSRCTPWKRWRTNSSPSYHCLKQILRVKISSGEWKPHQRILSEHQLMEAIRREPGHRLPKPGGSGCREIQLPQAGQRLLRDSPKIEQAFLGFHSFTEEMRRKGLKPSSRVLFQKLDASRGDVARSIGVPEGTKVVVLSQLRLVNDEFIILKTSFMPQNRAGASRLAAPPPRRHHRPIIFLISLLTAIAPTPAVIPAFAGCVIYWPQEHLLERVHSTSIFIYSAPLSKKANLQYTTLRTLIYLLTYYSQSLNFVERS